MINGIMGKILRIDLTTRNYQIEELPEDVYTKYIGSRGIGSELFYNEVPAGIDPFSAENKIIIMSGLFNGSRVPATSKHTWTTKSPLTGFYGEGSTSGGKFGIYLKRNGYDGAIIEGCSEDPVYITIQDGKVSFHNAKYLWGLTITETERILKEKNRDVQAAIIGPAGENKVYYAGVRVERRSVGRTGIGSVMGSKKLKAIGVLHCNKSYEVYDEKKYSILVKKFYRSIRENDFTAETRRLYGTTYLFEFINENGLMPTRNFQFSKFEKDISEFNCKNIRQKYVIKDEACYRCPIVCGKKMLVSDGQYAGTSNSGPEWEAMWAFGPQCDNNCFPAIIKANEICNELGLDTISTGNVIGFAMECFEKGIIGEKDIGYNLNWGNHKAMMKLIHDIAYRNKFGNYLADGTKRIAGKLGVEDIAIQVKGLELPVYDPRVTWGMGLAYATSSRGGCHMRSFTPTTELNGLGGGPQSIEGKAEFVVNDQNLRALYEATGQCFTSTAAVTPEFYAELINAVTGLQLTEDDLYIIGERIYNMERLLAKQEGISRKDDTLPGRLFNEEVKNGPHAGIKLPKDEFEKMLDNYYSIRGWDLENGFPTKNKQ